MISFQKGTIPLKEKEDLAKKANNLSLERVEMYLIHCIKGCTVDF